LYWQTIEIEKYELAGFLNGKNYYERYKDETMLQLKMFKNFINLKNLSNSETL
jgi:hypothetical protein